LFNPNGGSAEGQIIGRRTRNTMRLVGIHLVSALAFLLAPGCQPADGDPGSDGDNQRADDLDGAGPPPAVADASAEPDLVDAGDDAIADACGLGPYLGDAAMPPTDARRPDVVPMGRSSLRCTDRSPPGAYAGEDSTYGSTAGAPSALSHYACAPTEDGSERLFHFRSDFPRDVTVRLQMNNACSWAGCPSPWVPEAHDLDLIVMTPQCHAGSVDSCVAASVTRSFEDETVSFRAEAGQDYWLVVDSPAGQEGTFALIVDCPSCFLPPVGRLDCNTSVAGDTATGNPPTQSRYSTCTSSQRPTVPFDGQHGPEVVYDLAVGPATNYTVRLTPLQGDLSLFAVFKLGGACRDLGCDAGSAASTTTAGVIHFTEAAVYPSFARTVVVDGPDPAGGPYRLEVACTPGCAPSRTLLCPDREVDNTVDGRRDTDRWGSCAADLTGPELVYNFGKPPAGRYTAALSELEADLDLIVLRAWASDFLCDPATSCLASSTTLGIGDEQVSFEADGVSSYLLAVDGRAGVTSRFVLTIQSGACRP
jgi:hypothetical protein